MCKTTKDSTKQPKTHTIEIHRHGRISTTTGTIDELTKYFGYTLEVGKSYDKTVQMAPKTIKSLIVAINKAKTAAAANGCPDTYYTLAE